MTVLAATLGRRRWQEPACPGSDEPGTVRVRPVGRPGVLANTPTARGVFRQRDTPHRRSARAAVETSDLQGLLDLLAPDVVPWTDGGGIVQSALVPAVGADEVAHASSRIAAGRCGGSGRAKNYS
ncbi:RNA polymerase sigma factor SigJ [Streptomyces sp. ADI95-17]|nr:RNA polymerase sigma factor SigJ [Streptomyces sp. ADI95-17]